MKISTVQCLIFCVGFILIFLETIYFSKIISWGKLDKIDDSIPPFLPLVNDFQVIPKHNLLSCNIRKSMSQLSYNIMCYLNDPKEFERNNQSFSETWKDTRNNACWDCDADIHCVVRNIHESLQKYVLNPNHNKTHYETWIDWHVAPQTWNCDFKNFLQDFHLIHIGPSYRERSRALEKLKLVLESVRIPDEQIQKVMGEVKNGTTDHATYLSRDRRNVLRSIRNDEYVKEFFWKIYYHDYLTFGFPVDRIFGNFNKLIN
ncbi:hypothetical protein CAEBREN_14282 [Caenorhabditis brenneri]|uniref:Uncharacterized protein n=1 Tax=Caenorhabditis brenneri TaxID=135651 RepID=G0NIR8_CAEBE|nr:hypothetical protein CAEBREN_14282 [Caenorhabditis brenneri]